MVYGTHWRKHIAIGAGKDDATKATDRNNKQAKFNSCAPFTNYISEINNTQVDNANTSWCCYADL